MHSGKTDSGTRNQNDNKPLELASCPSGATARRNGVPQRPPFEAKTLPRCMTVAWALAPEVKTAMDRLSWPRVGAAPLTAAAACRKRPTVVVGALQRCRTVRWDSGTCI